MALLESFILIAIVIILIYKWLTAKNMVLKERSVPHDTPWPLIGNMDVPLLLSRKPFIKFLLQKCEKFKDSKVFGFYNMRDPLFLIRDVELIKQIGIKDSDSFINHGQSFPSDDSDMSRSLIMLKDRKWKAMRNTLTPTFTSSKMRLMYELVNECSIEGAKYLEAQIKATDAQEYELEMKDFFTRFANDVIASAAFGFKVNSFEDKDNDFFTIGSKMSEFSGLVFLKAMFIIMVPKLAKALNVTMFDKAGLNYFGRVVLDAMKQRKQNHIVRPDMINLLMAAKEHAEELQSDPAIEQAELTDRDIVAQCLLFFFAGFDTVSTCLCFTLHELMENPEAQEKLHEEIMSVEKKLNGAQLNYDDLMKMKYLDMVISESLRKWPPTIFLDRGCSKDYDLKDEDGNLVVQFKKGDTLWVPIVGIHRDSRNFENPTKFVPERFSDVNKGNIKPMTYLPFGVGPRNCIGNRFGLMETKSIIYHILLRFRVHPTAKTSKDLLSSMRGFQMIPKEKFWLKFVKRED